VLAGFVAMSDSLKPDATAVIRYLHDKLRLDVWMVTGDNVATATHVARLAGLPADRIVAGVKPIGKLEHVRRLQKAGQSVVFIGDGINDAPALAAAEVGVAVGSGMDVAIETADVVLMKSDLSSVATCLDLSRACMRRIGRAAAPRSIAYMHRADLSYIVAPPTGINFVWACAYNAVGLPLAAGVLYPMVTLPPMFAGAAMALSSVSVICSSLLLKCYRPPRCT
jgi:Cu+-exporting ATPase